MTPHPLVQEKVDAYLSAVDAEAPGLVEGLYVEGSVALGDFRPGASDVDFVAVTAGTPDPGILRRVHERLPRDGPDFDGVYLTWDDLANGPTTGRPAALEGGFLADGGVPTPVTWHTLAQAGVTCRGPAGPATWTDPAALAAWQNDNLDTYWARALASAADVHTRAGRLSLTDYGTAWTVTGVSRLHYTLTTGAITSKDGAGEHALATFPERWHPIVEEGLRIHRGQPSRRRDVLDFGAMVIADGHRAYESR